MCGSARPRPAAPSPSNRTGRPRCAPPSPPTGCRPRRSRSPTGSPTPGGPWPRATSRTAIGAATLVGAEPGIAVPEPGRAPRGLPERVLERAIQLVDACRRWWSPSRCQRWHGPVRARRCRRPDRGVAKRTAHPVGVRVTRSAGPRRRPRGVQHAEPSAAPWAPVASVQLHRRQLEVLAEVQGAAGRAAGPGCPARGPAARLGHPARAARSARPVRRGGSTAAAGRRPPGPTRTGPSTPLDGCR